MKKEEHLPTTTMKVINSGYEISASLMTPMYMGIGEEHK
jgi:hypothetical protein